MKWYTPGGMAYNVYLDMLKQHHLLIAGTTGSGKSVLINSLIYTALYKSPERVQFVFIDPKKTELYDYRNLPQCIAYRDTPETAFNALSAVVTLIEERNTRARAQGLKHSTEPHIYVVIDELSDLIFSNRKSVSVIARIAMTGRASNIHLIAATQCPNRKTLSAEIVANFTARVALRCKSKIESRQIINITGAETLPKWGYGLYDSPDTMQPKAIQIPMTDPAELAERVQWWTSQAPKFSFFRRNAARI